MKLWGAILTAFALTACSGMVETSSLNGSSGITATPTPAFTCENYYNDDLHPESPYFSTLADCQNTTEANCDWTWKPFPDGSSALCYTPLPGWETCSMAPASWIYTTWAVSCFSSGTTYGTSRSTVGCSSTICLCSGTPDLYSTCTGASCPSPIPTPLPTCAP